MNILRELLLARHRGSHRALASARRRALLESLPPARLLWWRVLLTEFFAPQRVAWAALAASWVLILAMQWLASGESTATRVPPSLVQDALLSAPDAALMAQFDFRVHPEVFTR